MKLVVVKNQPGLSEADLRRFCEARFSGLKRPKCIEFRDDLPLEAIGTLPRRERRAAKS